jgi:hypothetical protein
MGELTSKRTQFEWPPELRCPVPLEPDLPIEETVSGMGVGYKCHGCGQVGILCVKDSETPQGMSYRHHCGSTAIAFADRQHVEDDPKPIIVSEESK